MIDPAGSQVTSPAQGPSSPLEELLLRRVQGETGDTDLRQLQPQEQTQTLKPNLPAAYRLPASALERSYSERAGTDLRQFGYESFGRPSQVTVRHSGAMNDSYILGAGDQIIVEIRGHESRSHRVTVNRDGTVVLPRLKPVLAAGRRFGEFRAELEQLIAESFVATQGYVTVGTVRQVSVFVAGEVNAPGAITVNALNSPIDALLLAVGVKKSGSLRRIVIERGGGQIPIDLYGVLAGLRVPLETTLADGDKIIVPPTGPTVAIVGEVARPGIYELGSGSGITAGALVELAGGYLVGGAKRLTVLRVHADGTEAFEPTAAASATRLQKSEILFVLPSANVAKGRIVLEGQVRIPGTYDLARTPSLRSLLASADLFEEDAFILFALISRKDSATLSRTFVPFAPIQILRGQQDISLQDDDIVRIFSGHEVRELTAELTVEQSRRDVSSEDLRALRSARARTEETAAPQATTPQAQSQGTVGAALAGQEQIRQIDPQQLQQLQGYASGQPGSDDLGQLLEQRGPSGPSQLYTPYAGGGGLSPEGGLPLPDEGALPEKRKELTSRTLIVDLRHPALRNRLASYRTSILGAVALPGEYLVAPGVGLDAVIGAVGGLTVEADLTGIEITSTDYASGGIAKTSRTSFSLARDQLARVTVHPGDVVRIREFYTERDAGQIIVRGQVRFPGKFDLLRGERLSSVIVRAGGLTEIAYPYGAVFTRRTAARAEEDGYRRAAQELERAFTVIVADTQTVSPQGIQFIRDTIDRLQSAEGVGRISVEADPARLGARPERDTILEPDDFLFIPRRPNSVSVTGEVLSAGSYLFTSSRSGSYYINLAGGFGPAADRDRTFVLMPDGTARPLYGSIFRFGSISIVPGATVIVPRDLRPFRFRQFALDLTQIISQLAVAAASIAVISNQ